MAMSTQSNTQYGFLREKQIRQLIPIAHSTLWLWVREGKFPTPMKLSPKVLVWDAKAVREFIEQNISKKEQS